MPCRRAKSAADPPRTLRQVDERAVSEARDQVPEIASSCYICQPGCGWGWEGMWNCEVGRRFRGSCQGSGVLQLTAR